MIIPSGVVASARRLVCRRCPPLPRASSSSSAAAQYRTAAMADDGPRIMFGGIGDAPPGSENDLHNIELARFAVTEHNNQTNGTLEFERLVKVRQQVVAGKMYYFTVEVKEGGAKELYEAQVWERKWENFKGLQSFRPGAA